jgi:hypothetical protein
MARSGSNECGNIESNNWKKETPDENDVIDPDLNQQRVQTNKWLAKKMQFQQPDIRKEIDRHRTIIRE